MNEKSDLPDDWAIPNDLSKKISEVLNNKSITPINELADALDDMARDNTWQDQIHMLGKIGHLIYWSK